MHLQLFPDLPHEWRDDPLAAKWETIRAIRRRIRLTLRCSLNIVRKGQARVSASCGPGRTSAELLAREQQPLPGGELPSKQRRVDLGMVLPRSVRPRAWLL